MAVAFDSVGPSAAGATISGNAVLTFAHTVAGNNVLLLAGIAVDANPDGSLTCTCTYGGSAMTSLGVRHSGGSNVGFLQVFAIETVPGTANVVATVAGGTPATLSGGSIAFSGAAAPVAVGHGTPASSDSGGVNATTSTCALASNTSGNIIAGFTTSGTSIASATAPSTSRFIKSQTGGAAASSVAGATSPATGSPVTMAWTMGSDFYAEFMVEILPFGGGGGPIRLAQQQSRALMKRRKASQRPQFNIQSPDVSIPVPTITASANVPVPALVRCITGLGGSGAGYFVDQTGAPRFVIGDAPWALPGNAGRWNSGNWQADYDTYLGNRAAQGYTVIYTKPIGTTQSLNLDDNGKTFDALYPFQGGTPATGVAGANPSTGLTATFWARIDYMLNSALNKGITIFLNAIGYNTDFNSGPGPLFGKSAGEFTAYGAALGARYKNQPNLVWNLADDYFGNNDGLITAFMTGVSGAGDTHAVSIENFPESTSRQDVSNAAACSWGVAHGQYNWCYSYNATYFAVEKAFAESSPIPVIQGDGYFGQGGSTYSATLDRAMRQDAWHAVSSGARGVIQGFESIWQYQSTALASSGTDWYPSSNVGNIRTLMESLPSWYMLIPDTSSVLVTAGRGTHATTFTSGGSGGQLEPAFTDTYVTASRCADSSLAVIYMSHATTITIDQTKMAAGYTATWVDPVTCATSSATPGSTYNSTAKGNNSKGDPDWVLILQGPAAGGATQAPVIAPGAATTQAANW